MSEHNRHHRECDDTCTFDCGRCKGRAKRTLTFEVEIAKRDKYKVLHCQADALYALKEIGVVVTNVRNEPRD